MTDLRTFAVTTKADRVIFLALKPGETFEDWWIGLINQGGDILFAQEIPVPTRARGKAAAS